MITFFFFFRFSKASYHPTKRHVKSVYKLAYLYMNGEGVKENCEKALKLFKYCAEYYYVKYDLENGRKAFEEDRYVESFTMYSQLAEMGFENGQINIAWLISENYYEYSDFYIENFDNEELLQHVFTIDWQRKENLLFRYYTFAAIQNNTKALRVIGDYYWYSKYPITKETRDYCNSLTLTSESESELRERSGYYIGNLDLNCLAYHRLNEEYSSSNRMIINGNEKDAKYIACSFYDISARDMSITKNNEFNNASSDSRIANLLLLMSNQTLIENIYGNRDSGQSLYNLGYCFEHGIGRERDIEFARLLYYHGIEKNSDKGAWFPMSLTLVKLEFYQLPRYYKLMINNIIDFYYLITDIDRVIEMFYWLFIPSFLIPYDYRYKWIRYEIENNYISILKRKTNFEIEKQISKFNLDAYKKSWHSDAMFMMTILMTDFDEKNSDNNSKEKQKKQLKKAENKKDILMSGSLQKILDEFDIDLNDFDAMLNEEEAEQLLVLLEWLVAIEDIVLVIFSLLFVAMLFRPWIRRAQQNRNNGNNNNNNNNNGINGNNNNNNNGNDNNGNNNGNLNRHQRQRQQFRRVILYILAIFSFSMTLLSFIFVILLFVLDF